MAKCWTINCENLKGRDETFYFENYKIAKRNYDILCEKNKKQEEFFKIENTASWFDANYNENSTYITLIEADLPIIYNKIIF